jgi:YD repeat-containing protein
MGVDVGMTILAAGGGTPRRLSFCVVCAWHATGRTETLTEPSGQVTTLQYDKLGRLKTLTGPGSTTSYGDPASMSRHVDRMRL